MLIWSDGVRGGAWAAGNHSDARAAAAEAAAAHAAALQAHAAAAAAIEASNNAGLPADTLDVHGLHICEALDALDRRRALGAL